MDAFVADGEALRSVMVAFRTAAWYYLDSDSVIALEARRRLEKSSKGTDSFFAALYQDLDSVCVYLERSVIADLWQTPGCDAAKGDLRVLLSWLARLLSSKREQRRLARPHSLDDSAAALLDFRRKTLAWSLDALSLEQFDLLSRLVDLRDPPSHLREAITKSFKAAVQLNASSSKDYYEEGGTRDAWAAKTAFRLCDPLHDAHDALFKSWDCKCLARQTWMLASFATPCRSEPGANNHHILRFRSGTSWSTVWLDIINDTQAGAASAGISPNEPNNLHDALLALSERNVGAARLTYVSGTGRWTISQDQDDPGGQHDMVELAELIEADGLRKRVPYQHRVSLALLIAYAFLELGDSPWLPYTTNHIHVWLPLENNASPDLLHPFLEVGLDSSHNIVTKSELTFLGWMNPEMPCLPLLGKLIFELVSGDPINSILDKDRHFEEYDSEYPDRAPYLLPAVKACIQDDIFKHEPICDNEELRSAFEVKVIHKLQALLEKCPLKSLEAVLTRPQRRALPRSAQSTGNNHQVLPADVQHHGRKVRFVGLEPTTQRCVHDDGSSTKYEIDQAQHAEHFLKQLSTVHEYIRNHGTAGPSVKVAIIDTGAHLSARVRILYGSKLSECRSWLTSQPGTNGTSVPQGADSDGHGTHCTSALLKCIPENCEVYVAQVFEAHGESKLDTAHSTESSARVAQAIEYAINIWGVNVISMSFGYIAEDPVIEAVLKQADEKGVLLIAAASNVGLDMVDALSWPAAKRPNVMCIYAAGGRGENYKLNPKWRKGAHRLATLGVMVPVWSPPEDGVASRVTHSSGTSIATPVAAGIAACVLDFVWRSENVYLQTMGGDPPGAKERYQRAKSRLLKADCMSEVFKLMVDHDDFTTYQFVYPWKLFNGVNSASYLIESIIKCVI